MWTLTATAGHGGCRQFSPTHATGQRSLPEWAAQSWGRSAPGHVRVCCDCFPSPLLQEDRSLLVLINDAPKGGPGLDKLPKKYKHRKHASVLAGSCVRLEPLKPGLGESLRGLLCTSGSGQRCCEGAVLG